MMGIKPRFLGHPGERILNACSWTASPIFYTVSVTRLYLYTLMSGWNQCSWLYACRL